MKGTRKIILGAGISGLALAYRLKQQGHDVLLLEKSGRVGGWMGTDVSSGFLFERGPRSFRRGSDALLELVRALHLEDELIYSDQGRYLYVEGRLRKVPGFYFMRKMLWPLLNEWRVPPHAEDETIFAFASRRFNARVAELLFDPLTLGVYAGDSRELSVTACFPHLKSSEKQYGSLTRAFFARKKRVAGLFSFRGGTQTLVDALERELHEQIVLHQEVCSLGIEGEGVEVRTHDRVWKGDFVYSALPPGVMGKLLEPIDAASSANLMRIKMKGVNVVHLGYDEDVLPVKGFGYLIPSCEGEQILGVVFDSNIFPQQNRHSKETRLTVMIREEYSGDLVGIALEGLQKQLGITARPQVAIAARLEEAIPQYLVGHHVQERLPKICLVGNYVRGASINDCIKTCASISS